MINSFEDIYRLFPPAVRHPLLQTYVYLNIILGRNQHKCSYKDLNMKYIYDDLESFVMTYDLIQDDIIKRENVPIELFELEKATTAIDIGAHIGVYSVILGKLNPNVGLYCFEPVSENRGLLRRNLAINNIGAEINDAVVGGESGTVTFYEPENGRSESGSISSNLNHRLTPTEVQSISISDFLEEKRITRPFLKIDAEGAEYQIIQDIITTENIEYIEGVVEFHPDKLEVEPDKICELLTINGYNVDFIAETSPNHESDRPMYRFSSN